MPGRNIVKSLEPHSYYHVYNRGVEKRKIFLDEQDYVVFLNLLKRYLDDEQAKDSRGRSYVSFRKDLDLLAFCLMKNHFHLLVYLRDDPKALTGLIHRVSTSYTGYFNRKYKRVGHLFQDRYKASKISRDDYLQHISRYIHLNPTHYKDYEWSSLPYYLGDKHARWIKPQPILELFKGSSYAKFIADYEGQKAILDDLKHELASK